MFHLYRHYDKAGALLYVGMAINPVTRLCGHAQNSHWYNEIARITVEQFPTFEAVRIAETTAIKVENPLNNKDRKPYRSKRGRPIRAPKITVRTRHIRLGGEPLEMCEKKARAEGLGLDEFVRRIISSWLFGRLA